METDFIIIRGRTISTINAESESGRRWLRANMSIDPNNAACVTIQSEFVDEVELLLQREAFNVTVR